MPNEGRVQAERFSCAFCGGWYDEEHAERDVCPHARRMPTEGRVSSPRIVRRDQCRGSDLCCVNCGVQLDGLHNILCHAFAKAATEARRARETERG